MTDKTSIQTDIYKIKRMAVQSPDDYNVKQLAQILAQRKEMAALVSNGNLGENAYKEAITSINHCNEQIKNYFNI